MCRCDSPGGLLRLPSPTGGKTATRHCKGAALLIRGKHAGWPSPSQVCSSFHFHSTRKNTIDHDCMYLGRQQHEQTGAHQGRGYKTMSYADIEVTKDSSGVIGLTQRRRLAAVHWSQRLSSSAPCF